MGATYKDSCLASALEAATTMCASEFPRVGDDGSGNTRVQTCSVIDASSLAITSAVPATAASAVTTVPVSFGECDPSAHYVELGEIFGLFTVALAIIYALKLSLSPLYQNQ